MYVGALIAGMVWALVIFFLSLKKEIIKIQGVGVEPRLLKLHKQAW